MEASQAQLAQMKLMGIGLCGPRVDIDRRNCKRVVPMRVLCLGMPRTGTSTMRMALLQLGFADVYHMVELWEENPKDDALWVEAYQAKFEGKGKKWGREEWDALLGHYLPPISFSEDLIAAYPEAKVILSVRDNEDVWFDSMSNTLWTGHYIFGWPQSLLQSLVQMLAPRPEAWRTVQYAYKYTIRDDFPTKGKQRYLDHNAKIRSLVPADRFLEFNAKQGWAPLCEFLGVPVPDSPFPRVNDTKSWQAHVVKTKMKGAMNVLKVFAGLGAVAVGLYFGRTGWGQ